MRHIALEGRCFVLSACQFARGGSCIVSLLGEVLTGPVFDVPTILSAEIDIGAISRGTFDLDVVGHYARPDLFQLTVNTRFASAVRFTREKDDDG
jgi:nitrilase